MPKYLTLLLGLDHPHPLFKRHDGGLFSYPITIDFLGVDLRTRGITKHINPFHDIIKIGFS